MNHVLRYRYRIYPDAIQKDYLARQFGCCRFIWNQAVAKCKEDNRYFSYNDLSAWLTHSLKEKYTWLTEVHSQPLQQVLMGFARTVKECFDPKRKVRPGLPRFHKYSEQQSALYPQSVVIRNGKLKIPKCPGLVKIILHRDLPSNHTGVTIIKEPSGAYYASFIVRMDIPKPVYTPNDTFLGIDVGLKDLVITSDGIKIPNPRHLKKSEDNIARKNRALAKKKKKSRAWHSCRRKLARAYEKLRNRRRDYLKQTAAKLVKHAQDAGYQGIALERFSASQLIKGSHFAKYFCDAGLATLLRDITHACVKASLWCHKTEDYFPSTQLCNVCQKTNGAKIALHVRRWTCTHCGTEHDRDINAACNTADEVERLHHVYATRH